MSRQLKLFDLKYTIDPTLEKSDWAPDKTAFVPDLQASEELEKLQNVARSVEMRAMQRPVGRPKHGCAVPVVAMLDLETYQPANCATPRRKETTYTKWEDWHRQFALDGYNKQHSITNCLTFLKCKFNVNETNTTVTTPLL